MATRRPLVLVGGDLKELPAGDTMLSALLGATTVGDGLLKLPNPGALSFLRINADNTISALAAADFRSAIGAGTSSFDGAFSSLSGRPTTLSGYGITDAQGLDADLTALAGLSANGLIARTGLGTAAVRAITGTANQVIVTNGDGVAGNPTLSLPQSIATGSTPTFAGLNVGATVIGSTGVTVNYSGTGNRIAIVDLVGDDTYTDYGLRIIRNSTGANASSEITHRGTGSLNIKTREASDIVLHTNNAERLFIGSDGKVGIGTTSPGAVLDVGGTYGSIRGKYMVVNSYIAAYCAASGGLYMHFNAGIGRLRSVADNYGTAAPFILEIGHELGILVQTNRSVQFSAYGAGTLVTDSSGNITATSYARMKDVSGNFDRGLDAIVNLSPKVYRWNKESGLNTEDVNVGLIAQEVLPYIPEAVSEKEGRYTMSDRPIIAALVNAVQELSAQIETLKKAKLSQ